MTTTIPVQSIHLLVFAALLTSCGTELDESQSQPAVDTASDADMAQRFSEMIAQGAASDAKADHGHTFEPLFGVYVGRTLIENTGSCEISDPQPPIISHPAADLDIVSGGRDRFNLIGFNRDNPKQRGPAIPCDRSDTSDRYYTCTKGVQVIDFRDRRGLDAVITITPGISEVYWQSANEFLRLSAGDALSCEGPDCDAASELFGFGELPCRAGGALQRYELR